MKKMMMLAAALVLAHAGQAAYASPELAKAKNCMACHAPATKLVGPSYKDIAAKYASDGGAAEKLALKIQKGSTGVWGAIPMPANPQVNDADAATLAKWILSQK